MRLQPSERGDGKDGTRPERPRLLAAVSSVPGVSALTDAVKDLGQLGKGVAKGIGGVGKELVKGLEGMHVLCAIARDLTLRISDLNPLRQREMKAVMLVRLIVHKCLTLAQPAARQQD